MVRQRPWISLAQRWRFWRWPFFRGILVLCESLHNGISALNFSARVQEDAADAEETPVSVWLTFAIAMVMALGLFAALPHFLTWGLGWLTDAAALTGGRSFWFHIVDGIIKIAIFVGYIVAISLLPDVRRVFMYHGAEHMGIYAYEGGEELTVANASHHATLHPRCGTSFLLVVLLTAILVFTLVFPFVPRVSEIGVVNQLFFVFVKLLLLLPIAGSSYEVIKLAGKHPDSRGLRLFIWPGLMLQKITTREPDESQLEVSIASLKTVLAAERSYELAASREEPTPASSQQEYETFEEFLRKLEEAA